MSAVVQDDELRSQRFRRRFRRRQWDGILPSMYDQRRNPDTTKRFPDVEVAETGPNALLDAADDAERRQVSRACRVGEISGDAELERPLPIGVRVALAEAGCGQLRAKRLNDGALLSPHELRLELLAICAGDWSRIDQDQRVGNRRLPAERRGLEIGTPWASDGAGDRVRRRERVEHCQQAAPRVADDLPGRETQLTG